MNDHEAQDARLLLVEDEAIVALSEKKTLEKYGYEVITAYNGEKAVETVESDPETSLILMDIDLGEGMDGAEAAQEILKRHDLPIVFLTSHAEKEYVDRVKRITNYGYVLKGSGEFVLSESIQMAFNLFDGKVRKTESEKRYQNVEKAAELGVWEMDIETGETYWSDEFFRICGYEPGSITPNSDTGFSIIHDDDKDRAAQAVTDAINTGKPYDIEKRIVRPDGEVRYVHSIGEVKFNANGTPKTLVGSFQDITERKRMEMALAQKARLLEEAESLANLGSWEWDIVHDKWYFSEQLKEIHGIKENDFNTSKLMEIAHPKDAPYIEEAFSHAKKEGKTYDIEHRIIRADNKEIRYVKALGEVRLDGDTGRPIRMIGASQDITERKQEQKKLYKALEEKDFLMQELNHRVKNNLSLVSSLISLKESALDEAIDLSDIRNQINAIAKVHQSLQQSDDITRINIKSHVTDILSSVFQSSTGQHVTIENNIPDISVQTKAAVPLGLIINETATNALKHAFTGEDEPRFTVAMEEDSEGENYILTISNTGGPFPDDVDIENPQGLGLQLVSALVAQLQGSLELQRKPQPVFTIRFPVSQT